MGPDTAMLQGADHRISRAASCSTKAVIEIKKNSDGCSIVPKKGPMPKKRKCGHGV